MASRAGRKPQSRSSSASSSRRGSQVPGDFSGSGFANPDDFCNSFWDENGFEALSTRMRHSSKTLEEIRAFYKEKAAIEEEYGKRMSKLARMSLGKHEIGNLRMALDRVRQEVARSGESHEKLAVALRGSLITDLKRFETSREERRKAPVSVVEKAYKERLRQETLASKAKDKYKADCISINGLTAQTSLTQGRDLDKVQQKLEKHEATVQVNRDNWTHEWRAYCDLCQDLEEERMDFLRFSLWDFANALSLICVTDDESCEEIRRALERFQTVPEIADLARHVGTGAKILDAPVFVDYTRGHHDDAGKRRYRTANFARSSMKRDLTHSGEVLSDLTNAIRPLAAGPPTPMEDYDTRTSSRPPSRMASQSEIDASMLDEAQSMSAAPTVAARGPAPSTSTHSILAAPSVSADGSVLPRATTPAQAFEAAAGGSVAGRHAEPPALPAALVASESRQSVDSQRPPSRGAFGSIGAAISRRLSRGGSAAPELVSQPYSSTTAMDTQASSTSLSGAANEPSKPSAGTIAAGAFKHASSSQSQLGNGTTPSSPTKSEQPVEEDPLVARMRHLRSLSNSQKQTSSPLMQAAAAEKLARQSSQDLREPVWRPSSRTADYDDRRKSGRPSSNYGGYTSRGQSPAPEASYAGAQPPISYSSTSPALYSQQPAHSASPRPQSVSMGQIAPTQRPSSRAASYAAGALDRQQTTTSPPPLGIALDSRGQVIQDSLADDYARRQQEQQAAAYHARQRTASYADGAYGQGAPVQPQRPPSQAYASPPPQQAVYGAPPVPASYSARQSYEAPRQSYEAPRQSYDASRQSYDAHRQPYDAPRATYDSPQQHARQDSYDQQQVQRSNSQYGGPPNGYAHEYAYTSQRTPQSQPQQPQQQQYGAPAPVAQGPSDRGAPTAKYSNGRSILFYVEAIYDYVATIDEEFSFQTGDIIAVFQTDPDGWWQGELLDEDRRRIGGNIFPSNFTQLLSG